MDITPDGIWIPSDFNEPDLGLSFVNSYFNPPCLAQMVATTFTQEGEEEGLISNAGENPSTSDPIDDPITETFYDVPNMTTDSTHDDHF